MERITNNFDVTHSRINRDSIFGRKNILPPVKASPSPVSLRDASRLRRPVPLRGRKKREQNGTDSIYSSKSEKILIFIPLSPHSLLPCTFALTLKGQFCRFRFLHRDVFSCSNMVCSFSIICNGRRNRCQQ